MDKRTACPNATRRFLERRKMGWAHWQPNEEFIDIWFKSMQAEAKNTAKNKATQTEELGETQGWLASVASKPELSKQYAFSIATSFQCPNRNQGQEEVLQTCLQNAPERVKEEEEVSSKQAPAQEEKEPRACANPNCFFMTHSVETFGGFCCKKCHESYMKADGIANTRVCHGYKCERKKSRTDMKKTDPDPPENPLYVEEAMEVKTKPQQNQQIIMQEEFFSQLMVPAFYTAQDAECFGSVSHNWNRMVEDWFDGASKSCFKMSQ